MVSPETQAETPPFYRNVKVIKILAQLGAALAVVGFAIYEFRLTSNNLSARGLQGLTDFDFLKSPRDFRIPQSGRPDDEAIWKGILFGGVKNTLLVVAVGVPITMVLGTVLGVMRLSSNWLMKKIATAYVETIRNIPPLLVIIFFSTSVIAGLPAMADAPSIFGLFRYSNRFMGFMTIKDDGNLNYFWLIMLAGLVASVFLARHRRQVSEKTGEAAKPVLYITGLLLGFGVIGYLVLSAPFVLSHPEVTENGLNLVGGMRMSQQYVAVTIGLIIYTASHIAEIVRGSIQAVHKGQDEAAQALALSGFQAYWFIILPQAMRIAIPPLVNQFLNLSKNSSLAIAVGYMEITTHQFTLIGNSNPAPQNVMILMAVYLFISLTISLFANIVNSRLQLVGR